VPEGEPLLELRMHPSKLDLPVLRTVTRHGGLSDRMLDDSTFRYYTQRVVRNAGYWGELTIHAIRHAVANVVDRKTLPLVLTFPRSQMADSSFLVGPEQRKPLPESEIRLLGGPHPMWATESTSVICNVRHNGHVPSARRPKSRMTSVLQNFEVSAPSKP
jgi:hypothetical protein